MSKLCSKLCGIFASCTPRMTQITRKPSLALKKCSPSNMCRYKYAIKKNIAKETRST